MKTKSLKLSISNGIIVIAMVFATLEVKAETIDTIAGIYKGTLLVEKDGILTTVIPVGIDIPRFDSDCDGESLMAIEFNRYITWLSENAVITTDFFLDVNKINTVRMYVDGESLSSHLALSGKGFYKPNTTSLNWCDWTERGYHDMGE